MPHRKREEFPVTDDVRRLIDDLRKDGVELTFPPHVPRRRKWKPLDLGFSMADEVVRMRRGEGARRS